VNEGNSPPFEGEVATPSKTKCEAAFEGADGHERSECELDRGEASKNWSMSYHPVCALKGDFAFIGGAATPPSKGEELPCSSENLFGRLQPFYGFFVFVLSIVEDKSRRPDGRNIDYGCLAPARPEET